MNNPYFGADFFQFLLVFFKRMAQWCFGSLHFSELASDEIQVLVLFAVSVSCACVGAFLVLKRMTMLANSLSHTILPGLVVAYGISRALSGDGEFSASNLSMTTLWLAALMTAVLTALGTQFCKRGLKLQEDASIGLVSSMMVALGVVLVTCVTRNTHLGVEAVLGNIDALHPHDLENVFVITCIDLACLLPFLSRWKLIAFDPQFAGTQGVRHGLWETFLLLLTALTTVGAFRAVGILLVLSFLVGPVLIARLLTHQLKKLLIISSGIGMLLSLIGVGLSRHLFSVYDLPLSTSGMVSTLIGLTYFLCWGLCHWKRGARKKCCRP